MAFIIQWNGFLVLNLRKILTTAKGKPQTLQRHYYMILTLQIPRVLVPTSVTGGIGKNPTPGISWLLFPKSVKLLWVIEAFLNLSKNVKPIEYLLFSHHDQVLFMTFEENVIENCVFTNAKDTTQAKFIKNFNDKTVVLNSRVWDFKVIHRNCKFHTE